MGDGYTHFPTIATTIAEKIVANGGILTFKTTQEFYDIIGREKPTKMSMSYWTRKLVAAGFTLNVTKVGVAKHYELSHSEAETIVALQPKTCLPSGKLVYIRKGK